MSRLGAPYGAVGFYDRQGFSNPTTYLTWGQSAYNQVLSGYVVPGNVAMVDGVTGGIAWSELQPTAGNPPGTGPLSTAAIDYAFSQFRAYNATNPIYKWNGKFRIFGGENAPAWAQNLDGAPLSNTLFTLGRFWFTDYFNAWANFMTLLANYVPAGETLPMKINPACGEIVFGLCHTTSCEPCLKQNWNSGAGQTALNNAGWTPALDVAAQMNAIDFMPTIWASTPQTMAFNPYDPINTGVDVTITEALIDALANNGPINSVLGNNSLRANPVIYGGLDGPGYSDPHGVNYTTMYSYMVAKYVQGRANFALGFQKPGNNRRALYIQTSTLAGMGGTAQDLINTIQYALWLGACLIELPQGYSVLTQRQLLDFVPQLFLNHPLQAPFTTRTGSPARGAVPVAHPRLPSPARQAA